MEFLSVTEIRINRLLSVVKGKLRPVLRPVKDAGDLNDAVADAVDNDVGKIRQEAASSGYASAGIAAVNDLSDFVVLHELSTVSGREA
jgi:hypothetical protein